MPDSRELLNFVNGEFKPASEGATSDVVNPSTGESYGSAPLSRESDVDEAMKAAQAAFDGGWRDTTPSERMGYMLKMADAIESNAEALVDVEAENTGKPKGLTLSEEIPPMCDQIRFFAGAARVLEGKATAEYMQGFTSSIRREPIGVIGSVTPWNYPMMMAVWKFAPALAAGNTMVLKPSDTTPASTVKMAELFAEVLPPGVFNVVCGDRDTGAAVVSHPIPQMVSITGSIAAGKAVAQAASDTLKRTHLELGGKAPVIVFDDADLSGAAEEIAVAGYFNAGQDCTAATRVLANQRVGEDLAAALVEQAAEVKLSKDEQPDSEDLYIPPMNNPNQLEKVSGLVERAPAHAKVLTGGEQADGNGYFYSPDRDRGAATGRRDGPHRDLRPRDHRPGLQRRGRGAALGQRHRVRPGVERLDEQPQARAEGLPGARLRLRVDQLSHPAGRRDAPRRLQALRLRQGPVLVLVRGVHARQARDERDRGLTARPDHSA